MIFLAHRLPNNNLRSSDRRVPRHHCLRKISKYKIMKATNQIAIQKILEQLEGLESELERIQNEEKNKDIDAAIDNLIIAIEDLKFAAMN